MSQTADRHRRVRALFEEVRELPPAAQPSALAAACAGDARLEEDVAELLAAAAQAGSFLEHGAARALAAAPSLIGRRLGPYEIQGILGAGGMGEVYRARDTRLDRTVAIKVLPAHLATSPDRRQRFEREAKAVSALTHPHICVLYDVGRHDGIDFLVMEHLEGETLAERLQKGALPLDQALRYGIEIASALDKAHRSGIVHRDLKPGNVMLTRSGTKLLDFGLAKLWAPSAPLSAVAECSEMSTVVKPLTAEGTLVGTIPYMSPEQVEGREPDSRSDIFAFGSVLHEMATGERAFKGKSQASLIAAILASEVPPISRFQPLAAPALDRVVTTCLIKDREERWQSAHDLGQELKWIQKGGSTGTALPLKPRSRWERLAWALGAMALVSLAGLALSLWRVATREPPHTMRTTLLPPPKVGFNVLDGIPALAPDGRRIAFIGQGENGLNQLWVRPLDDLAAQALAGTEDATHPFWSADSQALGFFADGKLKRIAASGGPPQILCDAAAGRGGAWNSTGVILFSGGPGLGLLQVSAVGGAPVPVTRLDDSRHETSHRWPSFLPDGRHFLYTALVAVSATNTDAVLVGALGSSQTSRLVEVRSNALYAPPGYLLFAREGALVAQPFDAASQKLIGDALSLTDQVQTFPSVATAAFSVSENGLLAYRTGTTGEKSELVWFDRTGHPSETGMPAGFLASPRLSHDGRRVVFGIEDRQGRGDLWMYDLGRRVSSRFTSDPANDFAPIWSFDDERVVFSSNRRGGGDLYEKAASGTVTETLLFASEGRKSANDWSRDGRFVLFSEFGGSTRRSDIWSLLLAERKATPVLQTEFFESGAQLSPDGRWMAYNSSESGREELYVRPFPGLGPKWRISRDGGSWSRWRGDGKELYFVSANRALMAVDVTAGETFEAGEPKSLFGTRIKSSGAREYEVTSDGRRFLVNNVSGDETVAPVTVVLNWARILRR